MMQLFPQIFAGVGRMAAFFGIGRMIGLVFAWLLFVVTTPNLAADSKEIGLRKPVLKLSKDNCQHSAKVFRCVEYLRNYDGDTVSVNIPDLHPLLGKNIRVRLRGIDTAEMKPKRRCRGLSPAQCNARQSCEKRMAIRAQEYLQALLKKGKGLAIHQAKRGNFFRILGDLRVDGVSAAKAILSSGLAVRYKKRSRQLDWCIVDKTYLAKKSIDK